MPFTPFHLGPGALFKGIGGKRLSFLIFGGSQVMMDLEPLARMIRGDSALHGLSHTVAGAFGIAIVSAVAGRPLGDLALRRLGRRIVPIDWLVAFASAFIGTYSHIGLDAVMHPDMNPLWPFATGDDLLRVISVKALHVLCLATGLLGGALIALRGFVSARRRGHFR